MHPWKMLSELWLQVHYEGKVSFNYMLMSVIWDEEMAR